MSKRVYIDSVLRPIVMPWCQQVKHRKIDRFVLKEDEDSGHGINAQSYIVRKFKNKEGITTYRNYTSSPDLTPIKNCWQPPKQNLKKFPH